MSGRKHGEKSRIKNMMRDQNVFHDALVPLLLILCVLPLVVRFSEYDCGYGSYLWYSSYSIRTELYSYHKSRIFVVLAVLCALVLPFRLFLYRERTKPWKVYIPLAVYAVMALLSALLSENTTAALIGNLDSFENVWVLMGYAVVSFYTYQVLETQKDYRILWCALVVISVVMVVIGGFQLFKIDFLDFTWGQKLVMTEEQYAVYGGEAESAFTGNNVYLTLYNPNYAGIFLTMLASVSGVMALTEKEKKKKAAYALLFLAMLILVWFTYSRSTLVALAVGVVVLAVCLGGKRVRPLLRFGIPGLLVLAVLLVAADSTQGFYYLNRLLDSSDIEPLEMLLTTENGVELTYDEQTFLLSIVPVEEAAAAIDSVAENESEIIADAELEMEEDAVQGSEEDEQVSDAQVLAIRDSEGNLLYTLSEGEAVILHEKDQVEVSCISEEGSLAISLYLADTSLEFVRLDDGYYYVNEVGKLDQITEIPAVDFHGLEYLGSGRVYIWSRVLPILKNYLLIGSGPDTFAESFPQNDYAGKLIYANNTARVIEKAHNDFLTKWVQTGMISSLACLVFYILLIWKGIRIYRGKEFLRMSDRLGLGCLIACVCYIMGMLFNDSTIQTGPMFWIMAGIVLSGREEF